MQYDQLQNKQMELMNDLVLNYGLECNPDFDTFITKDIEEALKLKCGSLVADIVACDLDNVAESYWAKHSDPIGDLYV